MRALAKVIPSLLEIPELIIVICEVRGLSTATLLIEVFDVHPRLHRRGSLVHSVDTCSHIITAMVVIDIGRLAGRPITLRLVSG